MSSYKKRDQLCAALNSDSVKREKTQIPRRLWHNIGSNPYYSCGNKNEL
jgi:hypothetical protein